MSGGALFLFYTSADNLVTLSLLRATENAVYPVYFFSAHMQTASLLYYALGLQ